MFVVYGGLIIFVILSVVIVFFVSGVFNSCFIVDKSWSSPYECGFVSGSLSFNSFSFTYFSLLVFFVVFDLEISLLLNISFQGVLYGNFFYYFLFLFILIASFLVEVLMGYVRWGY
uniref:NADH dehydrogenase subunit 3 n=1 Tax=Mesocestoides sp. RKZ08 TaxID=2854038 RepID=UPI001F131393|nr:NADH dehydrogenase subunit 3 [Mesocestoides sp. RKZ08]UKS07969.1 NADH dehydrogenase subunit 3 [Mesocestoides sp. RKZ08]